MCHSVVCVRACVSCVFAKLGIFFVFAKGLRAQRAGRVAPRRGGAKRRAAALGAAQRRKAPPQAAERRAPRKACFSAFNFPPIIEKQKMLTGTSAGIRPILRPRQSSGTELHGYPIKQIHFHRKTPRKSPNGKVLVRACPLFHAISN